MSKSFYTSILLFFLCVPTLLAQEAGCLFPIDTSLDSVLHWTHQQEVERYEKDGRQVPETEQKRFEKKVALIAEHPLADSMYRVAINWLLDTLDTEITCGQCSIATDGIQAFGNYVVFDFYYFYLPKKHRFDPFGKLRFSFRRDYKTQKWSLEKDIGLPDCIGSHRWCAFSETSYSEAIDKVRKTEFADRDTWLDPSRNKKTLNIELQKSVGDYAFQKAIFDHRTGYWSFSDTIFPYAKSRFFSLERKIQYSDLVFEGTSLIDPIGFEVGKEGTGSIFSAYLCEVNVLFKGYSTMDTVILIKGGGRLPSGRFESWSHGVSLSYPDKKALFFATEIEDSTNYYPNETLKKYPVYMAAASAMEYRKPDYDMLWIYQNIEWNLYQSIEKQTKTPRIYRKKRSVDYSSWNNPFMPDSLKKALSEPFPLIAREYVGVDTIENSLTVSLIIGSFVDVSYPTTGTVLIRYNPKAIGRSAYKNAKVTFENMVAAHSIGDDRIRRSTFPEGYAFSMADFNDSTLIFRFERKDTTVIPFMLPVINPSDAAVLPLIDVEFLVDNTSVPINIELLKSDDSADFEHYNYRENREVPYKHTLIAGDIPIPYDYLRAAKIQHVTLEKKHPDSLLVVTIEGALFESKDTYVMLPYTGGGKYSTHFRLDERYFLEKSNSRMRFQIPKTSDNGFTIQSGRIKLVKSNKNIHNKITSMTKELELEE